MTELAHGIRKVQLFAIGLLVVAFSTSRGSAEPQQGAEEHQQIPHPFDNRGASKAGATATA